MIYADYAYYRDTYYGDVITDYEEFPKFAARASDYIDRITMNRAAAYLERHPDDELLKKACCAGAEQFYFMANVSTVAEGGEIASETVGSHSISYRSGAETKSAIEAEMRRLVSAYLATTGLLYRGVSNVHAAHSYVDFG